MKINKIEIFGDSILRGIIFDEESNSYKLRDGYRLNSLVSEGIEIKNNSRIGATVDKGLDLVLKKLDGCDESTLVIFEYGGNDCDYNWQEVSEAPEGIHLPHNEPDKYIENYKKAVRIAKEKGASVALTSLVPIDSTKYMSFISKNRSYDGILHWLGDTSMLFRFQEYYSHLAERLAREEGCDFIDLRSEFLLSHQYPLLLCADGIHPTQKGHELIEKILHEYVCSVNG